MAIIKHSHIEYSPVERGDCGQSCVIVATIHMENGEICKKAVATESAAKGHPAYLTDDQFMEKARPRIEEWADRITFDEANGKWLFDGKECTV